MGTWATFLDLLERERQAGWVLDRALSCGAKNFCKGVYGINSPAAQQAISWVESKGLKENHDSGGFDFDAHGEPVAGIEPDLAAWRIRWLPEQVGPVLLVFRRDPMTRMARVVHDLRTPLAAIVDAAERLLGPDAGDPRIEAKTIARAGRDLLADVESLLGAGNPGPALRADRWDPLAVAAETVDLLAPTARAKGLDLGLVEFGAVRPRLGDPTPFRRILVNLVGNAVKFSDRGTVVVTVVDSGGCLRVSVRDEGPGIEPELLPRIFQGGVRGSCDIDGHGLGLANVRDLAAEMGGTVRVESHPGMGSVFTVVLPHRAAAPRLDSLRILLVEDCEHQRRLLNHRLRSFGVDVQLAEDGFAAESLARAAPPDVLLLDLSMPGRDGVETLRKLRANGVHAPGVALTASTDEDSSRRALEAGFSRVLTKPVDPDALRQAIAECGGRRAAA